MAKKAATAVKPLTKSQILNSLTESSGLAKKDVLAVLDSLTGLIGESVKKGGPGAFTIPGLCKIVVKDKPARPARKNVWVPLVQEYRDIPAKPASKAIKVTPLKALKDMV
ncbi:MAG: nucleoid DNA-binding protein [Planctomycetaceae bacterium]|jgi:nucleoid DNA-binding protein